MRNSDISVLKKQLKIKNAVSISVSGNSMSPVIQSGDRVTIITSDCYCCGDILVFKYKEEGLLIHRLVNIENFFVCKGDNVFQIEYVSRGDILGKVIKVNERPVARWNKEEAKLSYEVHNIYERYDKDINATMGSDLYKRFYKLLICKAIAAHREE